ncbi:hypothetical protein ACFL2R_02575 [Patescibacteria group bacterium]
MNPSVSLDFYGVNPQKANSLENAILQELPKGALAPFIRNHGPANEEKIVVFIPRRLKTISQLPELSSARIVWTTDLKEIAPTYPLRK